ncbi:Tubby-like F-box protein 2, partial [Cucurbita argyrosperma subsp. sororia]
MSFKSFFRELWEIKDRLAIKPKRGGEGRNWRSRTRSHIAPDEVLPQPEAVQQGQWANLPPELLLDIIRRVEESETSWPARTAVLFCASVCKSWRNITKEVVKTPEQCGRLTFPISLKQPGPRDSPIQCYVRRHRATSTYRLYSGLVPSENESDKLLLAAKRVRRATGTDFVISLVADDFSWIRSTYVGKLRSNFFGTKFTMYDTQQNNQSTRPIHANKQVSPRMSACNYTIGAISYELNVLRTRGPRRMHCAIHSIPVSCIQQGGNAPTPTSFTACVDNQCSPLPASKGKEPETDASSTCIEGAQVQDLGESLVLKNKAPRWHEQLRCWCLNFRGRVTVASVKNFQLVVDVDPALNVSVEEQEKIILQFGKIGKDIFTMDYRYPLSAFQAFAICLSSFDTKPACE